MKPRVIKTDEQHTKALEEIATLVALDPQPGTDEAERLELLSSLVEAYEKTRFPIDLPDPIEAIRFRMDQKGLSQADLVPYFGTRGRVSEVLSGKRPLSISMIRALHEGLGIPAEVLIRISLPRETAEPVKLAKPDWSRMPVKEMAKRGWISVRQELMGTDGPGIAEQFVISAAALGAAGYRRSLHERAKNASDPEALVAWTSRALFLASACKTENYKAGSLSEEFLTRVARLSSVPNGPARARDLLAFTGIPLVFEKPLPQTFLDGCSFLLKDGRPGIALTLRYDRLDNFWFTLLHELSHILRHISEEKPLFVDDVEAGTPTDADEREADQLAGEALIPRSAWRRSEACRAPSKNAVVELARELSIHPAMVVGRIHRETRNYKAFRDLLGQDEVSKVLGI